VAVNVMKALSNDPEVARAVGQLASVGYLSHALSPAQRELAYLAASAANHCHY
jgi:alkylhydroperoxidase family enzyme